MKTSQDLKLCLEDIDTIKAALIFYYKIGIGDFSIIKDHPTFVNHLKNELDYELYTEIRKLTDEKLLNARNLLIQEELDFNTSWKIDDLKTDKSCLSAYKLEKQLKNE